MSRLSEWWRRVFGEPAPLEHGSMSRETRDATLPSDRQALIDDLTRRQHAQANEITAATGQAYITARRDRQAEADGVALRREAEFWRQHGADHHHHPPQEHT